MRIPYTTPSITELEISYVNDAITHGWGDRCYEYIERFEAEFAHYIGTVHAVATSSCTGALHLGLAAMGIGEGDEVILADTNWVATVAPVVHLGARPIFVDVDPIYWCINPEEVERAIGPRTRAIIVTHLYGNLADMDSLMDIGRRHGLPVIEDAAEALGSRHQKMNAGSIGSFGVFSFHGTKMMTTGEGGMLVTDDEHLYESVLTLSNHGRARGQARQFWPERVGYKFKMSNVQAAIGCAQLERADELLRRKRWIMSEYRKHLGEVEGVALNAERPNCLNSYWMPTVVWDDEHDVSVDQVRSALNAAGVDARVFFSPLSSLPMFESADTPISHSLADRAVNLPSFHDISEDEIEHVCMALCNMLEEGVSDRG